jgi:hypothetical protein
MADNTIRWAPTTPDHCSFVLGALDEVDERLEAIHSRMEQMFSENSGATNTTMYDSHQQLYTVGKNHVATMRDHATNTLKSYTAAQEQDTSNAASVQVEP